MLDFIRTRGKHLQLLLLAIIALSFVLVGVHGYTRFTDPAMATVAKIGGTTITQAEWDQAHQRQVENLRRQMPSIDARLLDSPATKRETLDAMVRERVLAVAADKLNLTTGDDRLHRLFIQDPQFAPLRNPDGSVNKDLLAAQGQSIDQFEAALRQDMSRRQVMRGLGTSVIAAPAVADAGLDPLLQRREVQIQRFDPAAYKGKVQPTDAEIEAYYKAHEEQFRAPEQARIDYIVLDLEAAKKDIALSQEELRNYYEQNAARFTAPQERRASHILVQAPKDAPAKEREQAKAKAEKLLEQARKNPGSFAELAKKNSDDPSSAEQGGDLAFTGRGGFASQALEDAVFSMQPGDIQLVETEFGWHVVKLDAVRGGEKKPFDAVRASIEDDVRRQLAQKRFSEAAEQFRNIVYEQPDSLQPAIDKLKLDKLSATVQRTPSPDATGPLASQKLLDAVFGEDALKNKRNTDAIETAPNQLVSAHVVQHTPAHALPLAEVQDRVRERVVAEQAAALARKEGEARLAQLKQGGDAASLPPAVTVSRNQPQGLSRNALEALMRADAGKLPTVLGVDLAEGGYLVARVLKVEPPALPADERKNLQGLYANAWSAAEQHAYYEALRERFKVQIKAPKPVAEAAAR